MADHRTSHADRIYAELRDRLLAGAVPLGERLIEEQVAAEFHTSRTPVREALRRLEGDGHLVRSQAGGLRPSMPNVRSMTELYEVRIVIEDLCVRRCATAIADRALLERLQEEWLALSTSGPGPSLQGPDFVRADERFHHVIAQAGGNEAAARMLDDLNDRIRLMRIHDFRTEDRVRATIAEHLEIVGALLAGDAEAAAAFMRAHVQRSASVVRQRVGDALAQMADLGRQVA